MKIHNGDYSVKPLVITLLSLDWLIIAWWMLEFSGDAVFTRANRAFALQCSKCKKGFFSHQARLFLSKSILYFLYFCSNGQVAVQFLALYPDDSATQLAIAVLLELVMGITITHQAQLPARRLETQHATKTRKIIQIFFFSQASEGVLPTHPLPATLSQILCSLCIRECLQSVQ